MFLRAQSLGISDGYTTRRKKLMSIGVPLPSIEDELGVSKSNVPLFKDLQFCNPLLVLDAPGGRMPISKYAASPVKLSSFIFVSLPAVSDTVGNI